MNERYEVLYKCTVGDCRLIRRIRKGFLEGETGEKERGNIPGREIACAEP